MSLLDLSSAAREVAPRVSASPSVRGRAIATWRGRMVNEHGSARVFEQLSLQMQRAGFGADIVATCAVFAEEERTHGILCGSVVEALGGSAVAPPLPALDLPEHEDVDRKEAVLRNILSVGCLSESVAVALIGAERLRMPPGELRELLTRIYADEIGHARFGWQIIQAAAPTLNEGARLRLGQYLRIAFAHLEAHELAHLPIHPTSPECSDVGVCDGNEARELFYATVHEAIVPHLQALGLNATEAWRDRHDKGSRMD
jgi:hypothetical protein